MAEIDPSKLNGIIKEGDTSSGGRAAIDLSKLNSLIKDQAEGERVLFTEASSKPPETDAPTIMQTTSFTTIGTSTGTATFSSVPSLAVTTAPKPVPPKPVPPKPVPPKPTPAVITGDPQ